MADNSYIFFNSNINLNLIKVNKTNTSYDILKNDLKSLGEEGTLYANYYDYLDAKYLSPESPVAGVNMEVYRRIPYQSYFDYVGSLTGGSYIFNDFNVANFGYYHYLISAETTNSLGETEYYIFEKMDTSGAAVFLQMNWDVWSICNIEETSEDGIYTVVGDMWLFGNNLESGDLAQKINVTSWDTLGQYSKTSKGIQNYQTGSVSCLIGKVSIVGENNYYERDLKTSYTRNITLSQKWKSFCADNYLKLLRDRKGNKWVVQIIDTPTSKNNDSVYNQDSTISFSWQEVADSDKISIINIVGIDSTITTPI